MRKALALLSALLVMLASPVPVLWPSRAWAQGGAVVTVRDAETESLLRMIAHPLFRAAGVDPALVRITLIQARPINAFVTTGNRMFINTGLIQQSETVGDLVGVLAHETGHIAGGHISRLPEEMRNAMIRSIAGMLLGGAAAAAGGRDVGGNAAGALLLGSQAMAMGELYAFTRAQEQAADQAGMQYLERLGWSGRGLSHLLERMQEQELLSEARQDPYFRTHPLSRDRLEFTQDWVARSPHAGAAFPPGFESGFRLVRAKLDGFIGAPATTLRRTREEDASAPARYARAIALFRSGRTDAALELLEGLLREEPGSPWLRELQGQILFEAGRLRQAIPVLREAVRLAPGEPLIRLALGRALMEAGEAPLLRAAVGEFEASLRMERDNAFVWRQLGIAEGRLGRMPRADIALAEEAMLEGDYAAVRLLSRRAAAALPPGPLRLRAEDLRHAAQRDNLTREQRDAEDAMRRRTRR
ncbi:M48 family metalloprotease [Siccirubricoccus sp. G192]|uniref:M48 family metalloprotease n=1 Tax=Siccirubricoccus sp. G192 TaxID=2849651 RepID=UPI001C2CB8E5|nr:M48 family metalloprotease [Siccirubricoccus sp. G192]MBV1799208.1 M48 family metalloprotease [Siccirubricoccus sp. G192]